LPAATTVEAAVGIARNPARNVSDLFNLVTPTSPFQPTLSQSPSDWLLEVSLTGIGGLNSPEGLAIDADGDVWVANFGNSSVTKLDPAGVAISPAAGFTDGGVNSPSAVAIDGSGHAWIANSSRITKLNSDGSPDPGSPFGTNSGGTGIAVDSAGSVWIASPGAARVFKLNPDGSAAAGSPFSGGGLIIPWVLAIGYSDTAWVTSQGRLAEFDSAGAAVSPPGGYTGGGYSGDRGIAIDVFGQVWATSITGPNRLAKFDQTGNPLSGSGYQGGGLSGSFGIAMDGAGNAWVVTLTNSDLAEFDNDGNPLSPDSGFAATNFQNPLYDAIDPSGNVWVTDNNANSVVQIIGAASPVATPLIGPAHAP